MNDRNSDPVFSIPRPPLIRTLLPIFGYRALLFGVKFAEA